jgi:hypothetical protein
LVRCSDRVDPAALPRFLGGLGNVHDEVVFLGAAVAGPLTTDFSAEKVRETDDVDCIVEVGSSLLSYQ